MRGRLFEILSRILRHHLERAAQRDLRPTFSLSVKPRKPPGQLLNRTGINLAASEVRAKRGRIRQSLHLDRPFDSVARALHLDLSAIECNRHNPQIDGRCQPSIQSHFFFAEMPALLERGVVQETEVHRLLDLVGMPARQEHQRDVRLAQLHRINRLRIGLRFRQALDQFLKLHEKASISFAGSRLDVR